MPSRFLPNSNPSRYRALRTIKDRKDAVPPPAIIPFLPATITRFDTFFPLYQTKYNALNTLLNAQTNLSAQVKTAKTSAIKYVSDFIGALQNAIDREEFPASVRNLYGLPVNQEHHPEIRSEQDVLDWGERVHNGETNRVAAGGAPITFPSLAQVDAAVDNFRDLNVQQANAKEAYDMAQEAVEADNIEADKLILKMWNEIEAAFDEGNKPSMRRKAREWGVVYTIAANETLNPDEFSIFGNISESGTGLAIDDAEVKVVEANVTVLSDNKGNFYVPVQPPATYTIQIKKTGFQDKEITGVVVTAGAITTVNAQLLPQPVATGTVSGQVIHAGVGVSATVIVEGSAIGVSTDPMGNYTLNNVPAGAQVIRATLVSNPAMSQTQNATVTAGATTTVNFNFA